MKILVQSLLWLLAVVQAGATIIPAGRVPFGGTWTGAGIPGGIPQRTTIAATLNPGATAAQIETAINAAASNSVVFLNAGNYSIGASIRPAWPNGQGVTLRGVGTNTILTFADGAFIQTVPSDFIDWTDANRTRQWTAGYAQGSSNITINAAGTTGISHQDIQVGTILFLSQLNDSALGVTSIVPIAPYDGNPGSFTTNDTGQPFSGNRLQMQQVMVTAIDGPGTGLTIWPPIAMTNWSGTLSPQVNWYGQPHAGFGMENLVIDATIDSYDQLQLSYQRYGYCSNVVVVKTRQTGFDLALSFGCEIRHCTARESQSYGSGSYGYVISMTGYSLIEDNISDVLTAGFLINAASCLNVIAYNYVTPNSIYLSSGNSFYPENFGMHEPHPSMNLFEGNYGGVMELDFSHGSASHQTLFRNRFYGGPDRVTQTANTFPANIQSHNRYVNVVGNLLGNLAWQTVAYQVDEMTTPGSAKTIYRLDFTDDSGVTNYFDAQVSSTLLRHGNWDSFNNSVVWDGTIADHSVPNSLYLAAKPSYFGGCPWPPYDSASPSLNLATNLPAAYRYMNGVDPTAGGGTVVGAKISPASKTKVTGTVKMR